MVRIKKKCRPEKSKNSPLIYRKIVENGVYRVMGGTRIVITVLKDQSGNVTIKIIDGKEIIAVTGRNDKNI